MAIESPDNPYKGIGANDEIDMRGVIEGFLIKAAKNVPSGKPVPCLGHILF